METRIFYDNIGAAGVLLCAFQWPIRLDYPRFTIGTCVAGASMFIVGIRLNVKRKPDKNVQQLLQHLSSSAPIHCWVGCNELPPLVPFCAFLVASSYPNPDHSQSVVFPRHRCRYTIRFPRAQPCDCPVHRPIETCGMLIECSGRWKSDDLELEPVLFFKRFCRTYCVIIQSEPSNHLNRPSPHSTTTEKTGYVYECTERRPCCFETFVYPITWNSFVEPI